VPHALALALPGEVELACPTGVGRGITTHMIPMESRDEWLKRVQAAGVGCVPGLTKYVAVHGQEKRGGELWARRRWSPRSWPAV
jgi:hypothetical protein